MLESVLIIIIVTIIWQLQAKTNLWLQLFGMWAMATSEAWVIAAERRCELYGPVIGTLVLVAVQQR